MSNGHFANEEYLDRATTNAIWREVGERLSEHLEPDNSQLPPHLQMLLTELRHQER